jgi:hypothetical protein
MSEKRELGKYTNVAEIFVVVPGEAGKAGEGDAVKKPFVCFF